MCPLFQQYSLFKTAASKPSPAEQITADQWDLLLGTSGRKTVGNRSTFNLWKYLFYPILNCKSGQSGKFQRNIKKGLCERSGWGLAKVYTYTQTWSSWKDFKLQLHPGLTVWLYYEHLNLGLSNYQEDQTGKALFQSSVDVEILVHYLAAVHDGPAVIPADASGQHINIRWNTNKWGFRIFSTPWKV